jgi:diguanylate cyclase (GGDEF)-like protein/hemerythrin-like metal-binding protein
MPEDALPATVTLRSLPTVSEALLMDMCTPTGFTPARDQDFTMVSRMLAVSTSVPFAMVTDGQIGLANPAFMDMFRADGGISGMPMAGLLDFHSRAPFAELLGSHARPPLTFRGRAVRLDGTSFNIELRLVREVMDGVPTMIAFAEDVSLRHFAERQLRCLAYTDALTGLPNRASATDRLRDAIVAGREDGTRLAVIMADLDGLKRVNDTLGHQAGDALLQVTAQRFLACVRGSDTMARLGGDEFCAVLPRITENGAERVAARLVDAARLPILIDGNEVTVSVSIGIALCPDHGSTVDDVIGAADTALYAAKRGGRDHFGWARNSGSQDGLSMPLITWCATHEVGIREIDAQHEVLVAHLNGLAAALRRAEAAPDVSGKLADALAYARTHFAAEEALMAKHGYAESEAHHRRHAALLDDMTNFLSGGSSHSLSLTTRFLQEWILRHLDGDDRKLAQALIAKGVS